MKPSKGLIIIFRRNICDLRVCVCDFLKHFDLNLVPETSRKERKVIREKDFYLFLFFFTFLSLYVFVLLFKLLSNKETRKENQPGLGQVLFLFPFFGERK